MTVERARTLQPERELVTGEYRWFVFGEGQTGLRIVGLEDTETGITISTPLANPEKRTASHKAWGGARQSRAPGDPWDIYSEMVFKGTDPDVKVTEMFQTYGHASVGDMARMQIDLARVPMHIPCTLFNLSAINSGQEKSTRYQKRFSVSVLHGIKNYLPEKLPREEVEYLERAYQKFGELSLRLFAKHQQLLTSAFREVYKPDSSQEGSLNSRVLDCVRYFLLFGQGSGFSFETSGRDWARIISDLRGSSMDTYQRVGVQIKQLLTPTQEMEEYLGYKAEAPGLIRHTEPNTLVNQNLLSLSNYIKEETDFLSYVRINRTQKEYVPQSVKKISEKYSEGERMVAQYLLTLYPGAVYSSVLAWVKEQPNEVKTTVSGIIFQGHDNYRELPPLARVSNMSVIFQSSLGELRDWNRHRSFGRFVTLPTVFGLPINEDTANQILTRGFGLPLYLTEAPALQGYRQSFEADLKAYYKSLEHFVSSVGKHYGSSIDYSFVINLLPLAHQMDIWMHGDPKQFLYMTHQRVRPGGHINYRTQAFEANKLIADSDPYLSGMRLLIKRPDPLNREEFFDRS